MKKKAIGSRKIKKEYKKNKKATLVVYFVLRILVLISMILQAVHGNYYNAFLAFMTLIMFIVPYFIQEKFSIRFPDVLEILMYLFIFSAIILGEINNFYVRIPHWDKVMHTLNGFLSAAVGLSLFDLIDRNSKSIKLSSAFLCIVAFCFSMTVGVLWEFFEYGADMFFKTDMQKDAIVNEVSSTYFDEKQENIVIHHNNIDFTIAYDKDGIEVFKIEDGYLDIGLHDTMQDLIVNFFGAVIFSIFGYFYLESRKERHKFVEYFMPQKKIEKLK